MAFYVFCAVYCLFDGNIIIYENIFVFVFPCMKKNRLNKVFQADISECCFNIFNQFYLFAEKISSLKRKADDVTSDSEAKLDSELDFKTPKLFPCPH